MTPPEHDLKMLTRERHRIHLIGVAGSGMSGIAALLLELGHDVSGSDKVATWEVDRLQRLGLRFRAEHRAEDAKDAELVIYSSAIQETNPIRAAAKEAGQPIVRRAEALAAIMSGKSGIVVAGMHGKTTTSAMSAHVLREGGLHPSHYVGAEIPLLGSNAHWDPRGEFFVAKAMRATGPRFFAEALLILNIEEEHLDLCGLAAIEGLLPSFEQTRARFFIADDRHAARICSSTRGRFPSDFPTRRIIEGPISICGISLRFLRFAAAKNWAKPWNVPGRHNVSNARVIALASELRYPVRENRNVVSRFQHARRRFEIKYQSERFLLTITRTIRRKFPLPRCGAVSGRKRVLTMLQPHRYSRTQAPRREFARLRQIRPGRDRRLSASESRSRRDRKTIVDETRGRASR